MWQIKTRGPSNLTFSFCFCVFFFLCLRLFIILTNFFLNEIYFYFLSHIYLALKLQKIILLYNTM